jgi:hypothetical protein
MRLLKFFARSVLAITLAGIAAKANAQSIDELYQAAKKEGALSLHATGEGTPWLWTLAFGHQRTATSRPARPRWRRSRRVVGGNRPRTH